MNYNKYKYLVAALCAANATMATAQEESAVADTLVQQSKVQLAYREAAASDVLVGAASVNYKEVVEKDYMSYPLTDLDAFVPGGTATWGGSYIVFIDGVPRPVNNIKADEIESISFLKGGAAVALYGSHASKGALLITTKRGKQGDISIKARVNTGVNVAISYPEYVGSAEYMTLYNQARKNDGLDPLYSATDIYNYGSGNNPYRYPNVNFYSSDYIKKTYNRSDVTAEIEGGSDRAQYYTNISYYREGSYFKVGKAKDSYTDRFNVRGNVDINISDYIKSYVDANITFYRGGGYSASNNFWNAAATFRPNRFSPFIPTKYVDENASGALAEIAASNNIINGQFIVGSNLEEERTNAIADLYVSGESTSHYRKLQFETGLDIDLSPLAEGLSFHTQFAMDFATEYNESMHDTYKAFDPIWSNYNGKDVIIGFKDTGTQDVHSGETNISARASDQTYAFDARFNYDRSFDDHSIGGVVLARGFQYRVTGQYHSESDASLGLNLHYDFAKRYFLDASASVVHTAKLAEGHRNAFSPSVSLGWNLAKESFLEDGLFNNLTLSVSASNLANDTDIESYSMYVGTYTLDGAWWAWTDQSQQSTVSKLGANDDLDFIRNKEIAVGLNGGILNNMFTFDLSAFRNSQEGLIITSGTTMPEYMMSYYPNSSFIPYINYNENLRKGIEFALGYNKNIGEVQLNATVTGMLTTNEATKRDDSTVEYDYQKRQGKFINGMWGYECLGFFQSEDEIKNSPSQTYFGQSTIKPGDLKYKDQNGDGKIDEKDTIELGRWDSPFEYGIGLTAKYKGFTLFATGWGVAGGLNSKNTAYYNMSGDDKYSVMARETWTKETASSATLPRLTTSTASNNTASSDFWTFKNNVFRLSKVQLTYDFPSTLFEGNKILHEAQVYVSGSNLLTISKEREYMEMNVGSAPQSRFYNLGVKVTF